MYKITKIQLLLTLRSPKPYTTFYLVWEQLWSLQYYQTRSFQKWPNRLIAVTRLEVFSLIYRKLIKKVWHDAVIFTLEQNDIFRNLLKILQDLKDNRKKRVLLNGQVFSRANVTAAVQQVIYCVKNYLLCKERPIDKSLTY